MSKDLGTIANTGIKNVDLDFTEFYGGDKKGTMIQLTQGLGGISGAEGEPGYIHLTKRDAKLTAFKLLKWYAQGDM